MKLFCWTFTSFGCYNKISWISSRFRGNKLLGHYYALFLCRFVPLCFRMPMNVFFILVNFCESYSIERKKTHLFVSNRRLQFFRNQRWQYTCVPTTGSIHLIIGSRFWKERKQMQRAQSSCWDLGSKRRKTSP